MPYGDPGAGFRALGAGRRARLGVDACRDANEQPTAVLLEASHRGRPLECACLAGTGTCGMRDGRCRPECACDRTGRGGKLGGGSAARFAGRARGTYREARRRGENRSSLKE